MSDGLVAELAAQARASGRLGIDTEFMGEGRYRALLCLIQIAVETPDGVRVEVLDPLTEDFKAQVLQVVTRKMGPIARVMVKRAADAAAGSRERFVDALLHAIPEADRWTVQGEINKLA